MPVTLTENAAARIKHYLSEQGAGIGLRFGVRKSGCSGLSYVVDLANAIDPDDAVYESREIKIIVDRKSVPYVDGTEIDYAGDPMSASFKFHNPNQKTECGCGESFGT